MGGEPHITIHPMNKEAFVSLVERLVREDHVTTVTCPVTCRGRIDFRCIDVDRQDLVNHLRQNNPHRKPPDVRPLSNGLWVAVPRSDGWRRQRAEQLLAALGLSSIGYL